MRLNSKNGIAAAVALTAALTAVCFGYFYWHSSYIAKKIERGFKDGVSAFDQGDTESARNLFDRVLDLQPDHGDALLYRGQLSQDDGDLISAVDYWNRVPDSPAKNGSTARYLAGVTLLELGQARKAESALRHAAKLNPSSDLPHRELLLLYVIQMRRHAIRGELQATRKIRKFQPRELIWLVTDQLHTAPEVDRKRIEQFVDADAKDIHSMIAHVRYNRVHGRHRESEQKLKALLERNPENLRVRGVLADIYLDQNRLEDAFSVLKSVTIDADSDPWVLRSCGRYLLLHEAWQDAQKCFSRVVELEPFDETSRYRLLAALKRLNKAEAFASHSKRLRSFDQIVRDANQLMKIESTRGAPPQLYLSTLLDVADGLLDVNLPADAILFFEQALLIFPMDQRAKKGYMQAKAAIAQPDGHAGAVADHQTGPFAIALPQPSRRAHEPSKLLTQDTSNSTFSSIRLRDVHEEAGIDFQYFNGDTGSKYIFETLGGGVAVFDFDRDGWPDLYFPQGCPVPLSTEPPIRTEKLFRNRGDGTFEDVTVAAGLGEQRYGIGCVTADFDNDAYPDLFVTAFGRNVFYHNNGDGTFVKTTATVGLIDERLSSSAAFADWDNDGDLDLYLVNYVGNPLKTCPADDGRVGTCKPANFPAAQDRCYTNQGDGTFRNSTEGSGIVVADGKGLGVVAAHFDDDNQIDFYVANDTTANFVFRNHGSGKFVEEGLIAGAATNRDGMPEAGMGIACADLDGNGLIDLYVTNFYMQSNTLYLNQGGGVFVDATAASDTAVETLPLLGFGTQPVDLDLDGDDELFVANGHIDDGVVRTGKLWKMPPQLFRNSGDARFTDVSQDAGQYFQGKYLGRGVARIDWNRDGRIDLVVVHQDRPVALLSNESQDIGNRVIIELHGVMSNRDAIGARIVIQAGDFTKSIQICGGGGYLVSNDPRQVVGLGDAEKIDVIEIRWPLGRIEKYEQLPVNSHLVFIEGGTRQIESLSTD